MISENTIGVEFDGVQKGAAFRGSTPAFKTGSIVKATDGNFYQFATATAAIADALATVSITLNGSTGEYEAAATGGDSTNATGVALAAGDSAWFQLA